MRVPVLYFFHKFGNVLNYLPTSNPSTIDSQVSFVSQTFLSQVSLKAEAYLINRTALANFLLMIMDWTNRINNHYQEDLKEEALEIKHIELCS